MEDLLRELVLIVLAALTVQARVWYRALRERLETRTRATAILASPEGTNDPLKATEQATLQVQHKRIRRESVHVLRALRDSTPPVTKVPDDG